MPHRNDSYHQLQRFVLHLRLHVDDPPRNSLWKWKPSPASAARKCRDVIHFAQPHSSGRAVSKGGWGMGTPMLWKTRANWTDFVKRGGGFIALPFIDWLTVLPRLPRWLPQTKGQMDEDAVAILKRNTLRQNQSSALLCYEMLQDVGYFKAICWSKEMLV